MLEKDPGAYQHQAQETLGQFERSIQDPFIERVLDIARDYNQLLADTMNVSLEERRAIVNELDREWGSVMDNEMTLTGHVTVPSINDQEDTAKMFVDGIRAVSKGFAILNEPIVVVGEEVGTGSRVVHCMHVPALSLWSAEEIDGILDPETTVVIAAEIDGSLLEPDGASVERAVAWLGLACPELIEEIDTRLFNTRTNEEADAFLALRGLDINRYMNVSDEFTRSCIDIYLNAVIDLDRALPYGVRLDGYVRRADKEDGLLYSVETDQILAYVPLVGILPKFSNNPDDNGKWDIGVQIVTMPVDKNGEDVHLLVPVDALKLMYSVRNSFYNT